MKNCYQCGTQIGDNLQVCPNCGIHIPEASLPDDSHKNQVSQYLKKTATSPLVLAFAFIFTFVILLNVFMAFNVSQLFDFDSMNEVMFDNRHTVDMSYMKQDIINDAKAYMLGAQIPSVLLAVGIWMVIFSAYGKHRSMSPTGLNLIAVLYKVMRILCPIVLCFLSLSILPACSALRDAAEDRINDVAFQVKATQARWILGTTFFLVWAVAGFMIFVFTKFISTLDTITNCIVSGKAYADISMFVIVLVFLGGAGTLVGLVFLEGILFWSTLLTAVYQILGAIVLLTLRDNLARLARQRIASIMSSSQITS